MSLWCLISLSERAYNYMLGNTNRKRRKKRKLASLLSSTPYVTGVRLPSCEYKDLETHCTVDSLSVWSAEKIPKLILLLNEEVTRSIHNCPFTFTMFLIVNEILLNSLPISCQWSVSELPDVFRGCRMKPEVWNGLIVTKYRKTNLLYK